MPRSRRWDFLYDRQRQGVKEYLLARFAEELAGELRRWPPDVEWADDRQRARLAEALAPPGPGDAVVALALELARLDLAREHEAAEAVRERRAPRAWPTARDAQQGEVVVQFAIESCLALQEAATGARLRRADLAAALEAVARAFSAGADAPR
jgi:hypothetical protein